jgi:hypothetical protein
MTDDRALLWAAARPYRLAIPLMLAAVALVVGLLVTPEGLTEDARHDRFAPFLGTAAQVIVGLFVVVAVEARYVMANVWLALATTTYIGVGLVAAVAATSPSLPGWGYGAALALTLAGGAGALASAVRVTGEAIATNIEAQRERNRARARDLLPDSEAPGPKPPRL